MIRPFQRKDASRTEETLDNDAPRLTTTVSWSTELEKAQGLFRRESATAGRCFRFDVGLDPDTLRRGAKSNGGGGVDTLDAVHRGDISTRRLLRLPGVGIEEHPFSAERCARRLG